MDDVCSTTTFSSIYIDLSKPCNDTGIEKQCTAPGCKRESELDALVIKCKPDSDGKCDYEYRDRELYDEEPYGPTSCVRVEIPKYFTKVDLRGVIQEYTGYMAGAKEIWKELEDIFSPYEWLVSGMHFSVRTHSAKNYSKTNNDYMSNSQYYKDAYNDEYRNNFLSLYDLTAAAMKKVKCESFRCLKVKNDEKIENKIKKLMDTINKYKPANGKTQFKGYTDERYTKADRITDCIECGSCKLWGKIQIYGLDTAIKIMNNKPVEAKDLRNLVLLMWKLSETVYYMKGFDGIQN